MIKDITIGQYFASDSIIHKLDPRVKVTFVFFYIIAIFLISKLWVYAPVLVFLIAIIKISKIKPNFVFKGVKPLIPIILLTFILNVLMTPGEVVWKWGIFTVTKSGLNLGFFMAFRLIFLVLDEPTAGLDPLGRDMILNQIKQLFEREDMTVILVSHSMEDIAKLCNRVIVIDKSQIFMDDTPEVVFSKEKELQEIGLSIPQSTQVVRRLKEKGIDLKTDCLNVEQAYENIKKAMEAKS